MNKPQWVRLGLLYHSVTYPAQATQASSEFSFCFTDRM